VNGVGTASALREDIREYAILVGAGLLVAGVVGVLVYRERANGGAGAPGPRLTPAPEGFVGCATEVDIAHPDAGDFVVVPLDSEGGRFIEYAWVLVQAVDEEEDTISGLIAKGGTGGPLKGSSEHGFYLGDEVAVPRVCLADIVRAHLNPKGEPICGAYGALVQDVDGPVRIVPRTKMRVRATVGPRSTTGVAAVDTLEAVTVEIRGVSKLGVVRGRIVSDPVKTELHGYPHGADIDLLADCIFGVE